MSNSPSPRAATLQKALASLVVVLSAAACTNAAAQRADDTSAVDASSVAPETRRGREHDGRPRETGLLYVVRGTAIVAGTDLRLTPDPAEVVWITDRPLRLAGRMSPATFASSWKRIGFEQDPPNAVLTAGGYSIGLELRTSTLEGRGLTFAVTPLGGQRLPEGDLGAVELFVDDAAAVVAQCGSTTIMYTGTAPGYPGLCNEVLSGDTPMDLLSGMPSVEVQMLGMAWTCTHEPASWVYTCTTSGAPSLSMTITFGWPAPGLDAFDSPYWSD